MMTFCTLFDSNYLSRGLAMIESLRLHCPAFRLYVFAFDERVPALLKKLAPEQVTVVPLSEFEDPRLLRVKPTRSPAEYCWTCTPSTIAFVLDRYGPDHCTYLDADLFFFADPAPLVAELGGMDVLITAHRYSPQYDQTAISGRFCVQFVTFRNNENGRRVLTEWKDACLEWCYARVEEGKFGDQKYLDAWPSRFKGIHELVHLGGGMAPWNVQQYRFHTENGTVRGTETATGKSFPLVFYHFHNVKFHLDDIVSLGGGYYELDPMYIRLLYRPYLKLLKSLDERLEAVEPGFTGSLPLTPAPAKPLTARRKWKFFRRSLKAFLKGQGRPMDYFRRQTRAYNYFYIDRLLSD